MTEIEEAKLNLKEAKVNEKKKTQKALRHTIRMVGVGILVVLVGYLGLLAYAQNETLKAIEEKADGIYKVLESEHNALNEAKDLLK